MDGILIHSSNRDGFAGTYNKGKNGISVGCLLIVPKDWSSFNEIMAGVQNITVQVIREVTEVITLQSHTGSVPDVSVIKTTLRKTINIP